jgi:ubiquinone/menaquinone biosynthesis C-methylase UbiE
MSPGENAEVHATDIAPAMIKIVQKKNWSNFCAEVMDAQCLTFPDNEFTHSFTKFAIMAMPGPDKAAAHIYRTLKPGGTAVITTWKDIGYMVVFHEVQKAVKPEAPISRSHPPIAPEWLADSKLREVLVRAGFPPANIEILTHSESISTKIWGMESMETMKGMLKVGMTEGWTEEEKRKSGFRAARAN